MSTPIINADSIGNHMTIVEAYSELRDIASRLETDRAALMEALEAAIQYRMVPISSASEGGPMAHSIQAAVADKIRAALAAARANFPAT